MSGEKKVSTGLLVTAVNLGLCGLGSLLNAVVLYFFWKWFFVPAFALPKISIVLAIGFSLTARLMGGGFVYNPQTKLHSDPIAPDPQVTRYVFGLIFLRTIFLLLMGWIVHLLM